MLTKDDCMLLAGYAKMREADGEAEMPRALLDLAARIAESIGDTETAGKLRKMCSAIGISTMQKATPAVSGGVLLQTTQECI